MRAAERFGTPDTEPATLISCVLLDRNIITDKDRHEIVDRNVVRRQRKRIRQDSLPTKRNISGLYFDSKIDDTLQPNKTIQPENHLTILNEPGSEYVCYTPLPSHKSVDILRGIVNSIPPEEFKEIMAIGADGTNTNTGGGGGAITLIERELKRKCNWNVSLFKYIIYIY